MINNYVSSIINKLGEKVTVISQNNEREETKAFIQPSRYKDDSYYGGKCLDLGFNVGDSYLYIGSKDVRIDQYPFNTIIESESDKYVVKRAQKVEFNNDVLYVWAILQKCREDS